GDDDRPGWKALPVRNENEVAVLFLETHHALAEVNRLLELARLLGERLHEIFREDFGKARDVEDVFLGVQRRQLTAELRQRMDDLRGRASHAGIEKGEDPGGTTAYDCDVFHFHAEA